MLNLFDDCGYSDIDDLPCLALFILPLIIISIDCGYLGQQYLRT